jgi:hypothetical protein
MKVPSDIYQLKCLPDPRTDECPEAFQFCAIYLNNGGKRSSLDMCEFIAGYGNSKLLKRRINKLAEDEPELEKVEEQPLLAST